MTKSVIKRVKRIIMMRIRRPFAVTQFVLILLILYLVKRSRDRHKISPRDDIISDMMLADPIDINGGVGLFEDSEQGRQKEQSQIPAEAQGVVGALFESINNKRTDFFPDSDSNKNEESPPVDTPLKQSVFKSAQGVAPPEGVALIAAAESADQGQVISPQSAAPQPSFLNNTPQPPAVVPQTAYQNDNSPQSQDTYNIPDSTAPSDADPTFHFPVPGEEVDLGALDSQGHGESVPSNLQAAEVTFDEYGFEAIQRPDGFATYNPNRFSLEVTEEQINKFQMQLPPLLENYRNPCWIEEVPEGFTYDDSYFNTCHYVPHTNKLKHGAQYKAFEKILTNRTAHGINTRIRCFPYFFLIGVGKSGTTDVFDTLKKYFFELAPIFLKEPHYWEWKRCIDKMLCRGSHRTPTFGEYLDSFDAASDYIREKTVTKPDGTEYHPLIMGDFTPSTLAFHPCWKLMPGNVGLEEPRYINAHYIKAIRPQTKFIAIMRDPVERIFSNFRMRDRMSANGGHSDAKVFHEEMVNILEYLNNCMKIKSVRACAFSVMKFDFGTHVTNSMYEIFIKDWFKLFPREQLLFLRMEDYMESRVRNFQNIVEFLGLEPMDPMKELMIGAKSITNQAPPAAMYNETRQLLQDFFRPFNQRLVDLLGDEQWTWGY